MDIFKWIERIIESKERFTLPFMTNPGIELIGATVKNAVQNGDVHAEAIKEMNRYFTSIAITTIMDLTVEAEAFGCKLSFPENEMPQIIDHLVNLNDIDKLKIPSLSTCRVPEYLKAAHLSVESSPDKPVFAGVIGPFSLATRLYGMSELLVDLYLEPEKISLLISKCANFIHSYCYELKKTGCSGIVIAEPAAGLLTNEDCLNFSTKYIRNIIEKLQDSSFVFILHNCGNSGNCTNAMLAAGAKAYHFGNSISMIKVLDECPADVLVMGNIDPVNILKMMTPEEVNNVVTSLLTQTRQYSNYVLSTGCDVPPQVPMVNIKAYYDALYKFNFDN